MGKKLRGALGEPNYAKSSVPPSSRRLESVSTISSSCPPSTGTRPSPARVPNVKPSPDWRASTLLQARCRKTLRTRKPTKVILFVAKPGDLWVASEAVLPEPWRLKTVTSSVTNLAEPWPPVESVLPEPFGRPSEKIMIRNTLEIRDCDSHHFSQGTKNL